MKSLLRDLKLDDIYCLDYETFYDTKAKYSLKNPSLSTTEYIIDPRFKMHMVAVQGSRQKKPKVLNRQQLIAWLRTVNWTRTGFLGHHTQFDGFISSHHFNHRAAFYFDTLSMARPLMPIQVGGGLDAINKALGGAGKTKAAALANIDGVRDLTPQQYRDLVPYAGDDALMTWDTFLKLVQYLPLQELRIIDLTMKMYTHPSALIDTTQLEGVRLADRARKRELVAALIKQRKLKLPKDYDAVAKRLVSNDQFAELLAEQGIDAPRKVSAKKTEKAGTEVTTWAMSKQDQEFIDLLAHANKTVRQLMEARFAVKSQQMESRCDRLLARAHIGPQPVYLKYYGAGPGRWSGGDLVNWQNLSSKRREGGAELRASVHAPEGHVFLIADLSQIEARLNAWDAGQEDKLEVFRQFDIILGTDKDGKVLRAGPDVYRYTASGIYHVSIDQITDAQRQIGKISDLSLGYQAGAPRFAKTLRLGSMGPPVDITDRAAADIHAAWRRTNHAIVANWRSTNERFKQAVGGRCKIAHGAVTYEGSANGKTAYMHGPGGASIRYDGIKFDEDGISYISEYQPLAKGGARVERTRLYGGILVQNKLEHLGRRLIADQMVELCDYLPTSRIVMSTHDEAVLTVPLRSAAKALKAAKAIMSRPPPWARNLPLAVDAHISARYDK